AYVPVFHEKVIPYTSVLVNTMYWDSRYPRLISIDQLRNLKSFLPHGLLECIDITCDLDGSVQFTTHATTIEKPFYIYDPKFKTESHNMNDPGVLMMTIDNLPSEFPREASKHFSKNLIDYVDSLSFSDDIHSKSPPPVPLPAPIEVAIITRGGK